MRLIGHIMDKAAAARFGDYLLTRGIGADIETAAAGFGVWIHSDDHVDQAKAQLQQFLAAPDDARYQTGSAAGRLRKEQEQKELRLQRNYVNVRTQWHGRLHGARPLTTALIVICLIVGGATRLGVEQEGLMEYLKFGRMPTSQELIEAMERRFREDQESGRPAPGPSPLLWTQDDPEVRVGLAEIRRLTGWTGFEQIQQGQLWRLITPIFIHFGWMHITFNLFWLYDLAGAIERHRGWGKLLAFILLIALISNVAQCWMDGPNFGGMSGVIYGLLGYVWMKGRLEPHLRLALAPNTIVVMLVWLVVCMRGALGPIGNTAHVTGLLTGIAIGAMPTWWRKIRKRKLNLAA